MKILKTTFHDKALISWYFKIALSIVFFDMTIAVIFSFLGHTTHNINYQWGSFYRYIGPYWGVEIIVVRFALLTVWCISLAAFFGISKILLATFFSYIFLLSLSVYASLKNKIIDYSFVFFFIEVATIFLVLKKNKATN